LARSLKGDIERKRKGGVGKERLSKKRKQDGTGKRSVCRAEIRVCTNKRTALGKSRRRNGGHGHPLIISGSKNPSITTGKRGYENALHGKRIKQRQGAIVELSRGKQEEGTSRKLNIKRGNP